MFSDETDPEERRDFFGRGKAKQLIVSALMQGPEEDLAKGEKIARKTSAPIIRSHRVSLEQMAILELAMAKTLAATCITVIREAMGEAIRLGVPPETARDFLLGHINIELAIVFQEINWDFSAGAKKAIDEAKKHIFELDCKKIFEPGRTRESVEVVTGARKI